MENLASKTWWMAAGTRCIKTAAQAAIGAIGASAALVSDVDWRAVALTAGLAAIVSLLTSLEGLPELVATTPDATTKEA